MPSFFTSVHKTSTYLAGHREYTAHGKGCTLQVLKALQMLAWVLERIVLLKDVDITSGRFMRRLGISKF